MLVDNICKSNCCREASEARSSWRSKWKMVTKRSFSVPCTATRGGGQTPGKAQTRRTGGRRGGEVVVGVEMIGGEAIGEEEGEEVGLLLQATGALHLRRGMASMERSKAVVSGVSAGEVMTAKVGVEGGEAMREEGTKGEGVDTMMPEITITGAMKDAEEGEEEEGTSGTIAGAMVAGELGRLSETSKVANSSSSKMVLATRVLIRRRSHHLCHLVVRRTRAGERVTPTIGKVGEAGNNRQNREVQESLMAPVELFRIGRTRQESRPIMT